MSRSKQGPFLFAALVGALMAAAAGAAAQEQEQEQEGPEPECICIDRLGEGPHAFRIGLQRARMGIALGEPEDVAGRRGVRVEEVPEGTPARRAGLREGDIIVALDGDDLGTSPTRQLLEAMADREPGDTVAVTFYRDGEEETVRVVTEAAPGFGFWSGDGDFDFRAAPGVRAPRVEVRPGRVLGPDFVYRHVLGGGLGLVAMNAGLGEYFDTGEGVLVTEIDDDSPLSLRAGDVILAVGGRDVRDPAHVRSILSSYLEDEPITFAIVREGRPMEVTGRRGR